MKGLLKNLFQILIVVAAIVLVASYGINSYVVSIASEKMVTQEDAENSDCILILGCGVRSDNTPTDMLRDRLDTGIALYNKGAAPKIIMSGDHGRKNYDEVNVMKQYAIDKGIPSEDIFMDHAGFSTYESMYRAKEIFLAESLIIVTQKFHLPRAIYIADSFGMKAEGVSADLHVYRGQKYVELREYFARNKDFVTTLIKPKPTYLGEAIPVSGNGDVTND